MPRSQEIRLAHSQNFLRDPRLIDTLLDRSTIQGRDLVYEIGPGTGIITERLAGRCRRVAAIEKDPRLADYLHARFHSYPNITVHAADFLRFPLPLAPYKVFANIPYALTTAIVTRLTSAPVIPRDSYLVVQREAAERFIGSPRATLYAALLYPWFAAEIVHSFRPGDFRPLPRVESVLLRLRPRDQPLVSASDTRFFRDCITFAFTAPRPTLQWTLRACLGRRLADHLIRRERLDPRATPSMIPGTLWLLLFEHLKDAGGAEARRVVAGAEQRLRTQQAGLSKMHRTRAG
ncbi:MAG TPA: 23S ribosomal RNA methyltransferase Erm [Chloroflexota bacterium]|nr:23S ribosomal RNA methyltransferase Erm [Chloroflexota bacterium]